MRAHISLLYGQKKTWVFCCPITFAHLLRNNSKIPKPPEKHHLDLRLDLKNLLAQQFTQQQKNITINQPQSSRTHNVNNSKNINIAYAPLSSRQYEQKYTSYKYII